jgi:hypothetical protein
MLNPVAKKWVKALRSGKYSQAKGQLKTTEGYCCLGVLCDLAVKAGVLKVFPTGRGNLPLNVKRWAGLVDPAGGYDGHQNLADDNDSGNRFKTIANIIESEPEGLFKKTVKRKAK